MGLHIRKGMRPFLKYDLEKYSDTLSPIEDATKDGDYAK